MAEFNNARNEGEVYCIDNNLVLVENTSRKSITETILGLVKRGYFSRTKTIDLKKEYAIHSQELQDLENWVQIY